MLARWVVTRTVNFASELGDVAGDRNVRSHRPLEKDPSAVSDIRNGSDAAVGPVEKPGTGTSDYGHVAIA
jgi:hypothetical protein